jgi:hypothetical protein
MRTVRSLIERAWVEKALAWAPARLRPSSPRMAAIVAATVAVVVALGAVFAALGPGGGGKAAKLSAPPWYAGEIPCRDDPMAHVHDASRFIVVARCATVSGTVKSAHLDPADGTLKVQVTPDSAYRRYLTSANRGLLTAGVIPTDQPSVAPPASGQHLTLYGTWVEERVVNGVGRVRLHHTWGIQVSDAGQPAAPSTASQSRLQQPAAAPSGTPHVDLSESLSITVAVPASVAVGSPMSVSVTVKSLLEAQPKPAPAAALYCEVIGDRGRPVQWKAASANANGVARVDLLASGPPGEYTVWVYAHKGVQGGIGRAKFSVTRR